MQWEHETVQLEEITIGGIVNGVDAYWTGATATYYEGVYIDTTHIPNFVSIDMLVANNFQNVDPIPLPDGGKHWRHPLHSVYISCDDSISPVVPNFSNRTGWVPIGTFRFSKVGSWRGFADTFFGYVRNVKDENGTVIDPQVEGYTLNTNSYFVFGSNTPYSFIQFKNYPHLREINTLHGYVASGTDFIGDLSVSGDIHFGSLSLISELDSKATIGRSLNTDYIDFNGLVTTRLLSSIPSDGPFSLTGVSLFHPGEVTSLLPIQCSDIYFGGVYASNIPGKSLLSVSVKLDTLEAPLLNNWPSGVTNTTLSHLQYLGSNVQTQLNNKMTAMTVDTTVTQASSNLITSGAVYAFSSAGGFNGSLDGTLSVSGNAVVDGGLNTSSVTIDSGLSVAGTASIVGNVKTGALTIREGSSIELFGESEVMFWSGGTDPYDVINMRLGIYGSQLKDLSAEAITCTSLTVDGTNVHSAILSLGSDVLSLSSVVNASPSSNKDVCYVKLTSNYTLTGGNTTHFIGGGTSKDTVNNYTAVLNDSGIYENREFTIQSAGVYRILFSWSVAIDASVNHNFILEMQINDVVTFVKAQPDITSQFYTHSVQNAIEAVYSFTQGDTVCCSYRNILSTNETLKGDFTFVLFQQL